MRAPSFTERLSASNAAKKAQLERAKRIAEDPKRAERLKVRAETIADGNRRIAEREAARRAAEEREAAELSARQAAEAAAREAERQVREEAEARRFAEQTKREAAETAEREAILAARRAGRKQKKRRR